MFNRFKIAIPALLFIATVGVGTARADNSFSCTVIRVLEWADRVDVYCSNTILANGTNVQFFAISKADKEQASRWISMASAALLAGKPFQVLFPDTPAGNTPGCLSSNCRTPYAFGLQK